MEERDYEDMEFEYTNLQPFMNLHDYDNNQKSTGLFTLPPIGTFSIPSAFFEDQYKKSNIVTSAVCGLLDNFSLDEKEPTETKEVDIEKPVSERSPLSPTHVPVEESSLDTTALVKVNKSKDPITQNESISYTPIYPISLSQSSKSSKEEASLEVNQNQNQNQQQQQQQQYPSHTFIYHAAPSLPADHIGQSYGALYYIAGIVKLICRTMLFVGFVYTLSQLVINFNHDMKNKIASYESDLLGDQIYCQQQYDSNRCTPDTRLPAVRDLCRNWERCMMRPISVSKSKVFGETCAELFNGFVNTLSIRTMIYTAVIGLGLTWSLLSTFNYLIKKKGTEPKILKYEQIQNS